MEIKACIQDTTCPDEFYNVNGTVQVSSAQIEEAVKDFLHKKYKPLLEAFPSLEINLLESVISSGFVDFCVEDKDGDEEVNKKAIKHWISTRPPELASRSLF